MALDVRNVGDRAGAQVVQLYVRDRVSSVPRPDKELKAFAKVHLDAGAATRIQLGLDRASFAVWDVASNGWRVEAGDFELLVGTSSTDIAQTVVVHVDSPDEVSPAPVLAGPVAADEEFAELLGHPVPAPRPTRPFTRNSTVGDLEPSRLGRPLARLLRAAAARRVSAADLDTSEEMVTAGIAELPLRGFVMFSNGALSLRMLDRVVAALNADLRGVLRPRHRPASPSAKR